MIRLPWGKRATAEPWVPTSLRRSWLIEVHLDDISHLDACLLFERVADLVHPLHPDTGCSLVPWVQDDEADQS